MLSLAVVIFIVAIAANAQPANSTPTITIPAVIDAGFALWPKGGAGAALDQWQKGGLIEGDPKVVGEAKYFKRIEPAVGNYKSYEVVDARRISAGSQVLYLAINFDRAAVYCRFLLYRIDDNWVVQNMDFNLKPELIVPWLAFAGGTAEQ
jgi:hypothetical protein